MNRASVVRSAARAGAVFTMTILGVGAFANAVHEPNESEIVTSDVDHFWRAFDSAGKVPPDARVKVYATEYFDRGSQGFKEFVAFRKLTPESFAEHVEAQRNYYQKIRPYIGQVVSQKPTIIAAFNKLRVLYPEVRFPPHIFFVVGAQRGAGMNSRDGIILAAEMFATPPGTPYSYTKVTPTYVPFSAVHETIHFNQAYETNDSSTLLQNVLNEGTADFLASLVLTEPNVRQMTDRWKYGCAHEATLAARLTREVDASKPRPWLFDHHPGNGWPPDMGYWVGYRIAQTFYSHARDKHAAVRELIDLTEFKPFLTNSGYPAGKPPCVPEAPRN